MYPHTLLELLLISLSLSGVRAFAATCYFPSGDIATGNVPCNNATNGESNCCGSADACLANGLCLVNTDTDTVEFGRGACTDQTWKSPDCFQHCTGIDTGDPMTNGAAVFECGTVGFQNEANYCCENGIDSKTACCSTSALLFQLAAGIPTGGTPAPSQQTSTSSVSTASPSTTSASTKSVNQNNGESTTTTASKQTSPQTSTTVSGSASTSGSAAGGSSSGSSGSGGSSGSNSGSSPQPAVSPVESGTSNTTKIAVGVAVPVGILLAALLGFLVWNNHRNSKKIRDLQAGLGGRNGTSAEPMTQMYPPPVSKDGTSFSSNNQTHPSNEYYKPNTYNRPMHELGGEARPHELEQSTYPQRPFELDGGHYRR